MKKHLLTILLVSALCGCSYLPEPYENTGAEFKETLKYIEITPENSSSTGVLIYPGGMVDPNAYRDFGVKIALATSAKVVIAKMPSNLAILSPNAAKGIMEDISGVTNWVISGHSLGGVMAAKYIVGNEEQVSGLILLAAYPDKSISDWTGVVLSLKGSEDGLVSEADINSSSSLLPGFEEIQDTLDIQVNPSSTTYYHEIQGGNHAQFGSYGEQDKDGVALITVDQQQDSAVAYIRTLFRQKQW